MTGVAAFTEFDGIWWKDKTHKGRWIHIFHYKNTFKLVLACNHHVSAPSYLKFQFDMATPFIDAYMSTIIIIL